MLDVTPDGLVLRELADGVTVEEIREKTGAPVIAPDGLPVVSDVVADPTAG